MKYEFNSSCKNCKVNKIFFKTFLLSKNLGGAAAPAAPLFQCTCNSHTNQTNLTKKICFFSYIVNITENLQKIDEKKRCFKPV